MGRLAFLVSLTTFAGSASFVYEIIAQTNPNPMTYAAAVFFFGAGITIANTRD